MRNQAIVAAANSSEAMVEATATSSASPQPCTSMSSSAG